MLVVAARLALVALTIIVVGGLKLLTVAVAALVKAVRK